MTKGRQFLLTIFLVASSLVVNVESNYGGGGGLNVGFYDSTCPSAESLVRGTVESAISSNKRNGAGLVRTFFHDCFVQGCDASVLIDSTADNSGEKDGRPNLTLHGFEFIDMAKASIEAACPGVVSCADILAIAARDSVNLLGGPYYEVKTGRRDGRVSIASETSDIPQPIDNLATLTASFSKKGLSQSQMVTLSGLHTIGKATCGAFTNRLYNFSTTASTDPTLDQTYAEELKAACPPGSESCTGTSCTVVNMDVFTPEVVDNKYYVGLAAHKGLFTSDETLYTSAETQGQVVNNAQNPYMWNSNVVQDLIAMGDIGVKTGTAGEIRINCRVINP